MYFIKLFRLAIYVKNIKENNAEFEIRSSNSEITSICFMLDNINLLSSHKDGY